MAGATCWYKLPTMIIASPINKPIPRLSYNPWAEEIKLLGAYRSIKLIAAKWVMAKWHATVKETAG